MPKSPILMALCLGSLLCGAGCTQKPAVEHSAQAPVTGAQWAEKPGPDGPWRPYLLSRWRIGLFSSWTT